MNDLAAPSPSPTRVRQQAAWASGDYSVIGTTLQLVGEQLAEACDLRCEERVLDVAAGNGNATLAAARRGAWVTSTDFVPELLQRGAERAAAERLDVRFRVADAEHLPFPDHAFHAVLSTFGVMFAASPVRAAAELVRVCRWDGRIGLANWTPDGFVGRMFEVLARFVPPPPGAAPPSQWGDEGWLRRVFEDHRLQVTRRQFAFRYRSAAHFVGVFRTWYGPLHAAFAALAPDRAAELEHELIELANRHDRGGPFSLVVPSDYLEVVVTRT